jgi:crotonobetainyl-CoA:carnitine CoA-transferase CaiB-like acyl-CoA transferase
MSTPEATDGAALPLAGVRVVEFCQIAAGPFCGMLLADMGADVIKVEPPGGDAMRQWPPITDGYSENFASVNRNKRSIALDLKAPGDKQVALDLIASAQVLIENSRPGAMDRLGLGYAALSALDPALVYCSISAFGHTGPRSNDGAFDVTMQALSGIMSVTGHEGAPPVKCGVPVSDFATGLYAAFNVVSALLRQRASGRGCHIDASMQGCSLGIAALQTSEYFGTGINPRKLGAAHPRNSPYEAYRASDEYFVIAAGNDKLWRSVCDTLGTPELCTDPRYDTTAHRARNQASLKLILEQKFAAATAAQWLDRFTRAGVPCAPINSYDAALADPQVAARGWVQPLTLPGGAQTSTFGVPVSMSGTDFAIRRPPPALDGDRDEILNELWQGDRA